MKRRAQGATVTALRLPHARHERVLTVALERLREWFLCAPSILGGPVVPVLHQSIDGFPTYAQIWAKRGPAETFWYVERRLVEEWTLCVYAEFGAAGHPDEVARFRSRKVWCDGAREALAAWIAAWEASCDRQDTQVEAACRRVGEWITRASRLLADQGSAA